MALAFVEETETPGIYRYALNLGALYPDPAPRAEFYRRYEQFSAAVPERAELYYSNDDRLFYLTESFVPTFLNESLPVLLVAGNPAPHSVKAGLCFAYERPDYQEHRFWKGLRDSQWLSFGDEAGFTGRDVYERSAARRTALLAGDYNSPFRIGIEMFYTFPSPASDSKWGGVSGLARLFGEDALRMIAGEERSRLAEMIADFNQGEGAVVAFQKDAYEGLRDSKAPPYSFKAARAGQLKAETAAGEPVRLFCGLPTRCGYWPDFRVALGDIREAIWEERV